MSTDTTVFIGLRSRNYLFKRSRSCTNLCFTVFFQLGNFAFYLLELLLYYLCVTRSSHSGRGVHGQVRVCDRRAGHHQQSRQALPLCRLHLCLHPRTRDGSQVRSTTVIIRTTGYFRTVDEYFVGLHH